MQLDKNTGYEQRAIFLAAVCGQTYTQFSNADGSFVVPLNYSVSHIIQAKSINNEWERFGFIIESPQEIIIAFRGTSSTSDWISDIIASQKRFKYIKQDCLTHRGFTDIYSSARDELIAALTRLSTDKTLYITGHSLGAALATLCATDIAVNTAYRSPNLYTYGSPRVGDPAFSKAFTEYVRNSCRIANLYDLVTYTPPTIYKLPKREKKYYYSHVQTFSSLSFQNGGIGPNHVIGSYFAALSRLHPKYTEALCATNPGFCPVTAVSPTELPEPQEIKDGNL
ncbi:lipase family protein [Paenibacillus sp. 7124]|uniref:Lipase family protein n=2 Tax=Paenibacillus TaxID=44249 RepID=A0A6M1PG80_9BACL|nr:MULTISPECIES: lipase family protein [Paenibacillus]AHV97924.1 lipase class 3 [Paenibacillus sabinae T27]NGM81338.1 lipase family protein [Paenibacillus apii]